MNQRYVIIFLLIVMSSSAYPSRKVTEFDYSDFNPEYRNFDSSFEKLEQGKYWKFWYYRAKNEKICYKGSKKYSSYNYKRYYEDFCKEDYYPKAYRAKVYKRYSAFEVVYV